MWLLVGLGNPGSRYAKTRHNIGFMVLDHFAASKVLEFRERQDYRICSGSVNGQTVVMIEPLTFMNLSGTAVYAVTRKHSVPPENIIVVHDDLDLATGRIKIRKKGSSGGHKGIDSIIQHVGTREFIRLKIGIGRDPLVPTEKFVLSAFSREEKPLIQDAVSKAADAIVTIVTEGVDKAMNRFNS